MPALKLRYAIILCNRNYGIKLAEVGRSLPKQSRNAVVESASEVGYADDMPEVYKTSMVRIVIVD